MSAPTPRPSLSSRMTIAFEEAGFDIFAPSPSSSNPASDAEPHQDHQAADLLDEDEEADVRRGSPSSLLLLCFSRLAALLRLYLRGGIRSKTNTNRPIFSNYETISSSR